MRRLPIYFLIDISESMVGEPIQQVEEGLATIIQALKTESACFRNGLCFYHRFCRTAKNFSAVAGNSEFLSA
ncbi:vWA domain-containing protein [Flavobacterium sp. MMS24-S5]|uniref:vWA domain-containing protein n=1 Tax=Flavobacterium sp. MMS24-S5 TaxID=3416605 RepID=UPI003D06AC3C